MNTLTGQQLPSIAERRQAERVLAKYFCPLCGKSACDCNARLGPFNLYYGLEGAGAFTRIELALRCHNMLANLKRSPARLTDRHGCKVEILSLNEQTESETQAAQR
jgi:hypothetical protein